MLTREELLETVNELNSRNAGRQVGYISGYRDQWFIGGYISRDNPDRQELKLHFCQGRNVGRINFNGGYTMFLDVTACKNQQDVFSEFELLDHHKRREKEKAVERMAQAEARCTRCINYLGRLTRNCKPSPICGYKRIRSRKKESWKTGNCDLVSPCQSGLG
ncbi:MAG TPA: hypothetical protein PKV84_01615 [Candidatus Omnitrophota bacterium]|nr:hypothetical protein [Candidatus Omnitrophota bacterium]